MSVCFDGECVRVVVCVCERVCVSECVNGCVGIGRIGVCVSANKHTPIKHNRTEVEMDIQRQASVGSGAGVDEGRYLFA